MQWKPTLTEPERLLVVTRVGFQTLKKLENKSVPVFRLPHPGCGRERRPGPALDVGNERQILGDRASGDWQQWPEHDLRRRLWWRSDARKSGRFG